LGIVAEVMAALNARDIEPGFRVGESHFQHDDFCNVVEGIAAQTYCTPSKKLRFDPALDERAVSLSDP